MLDLIMVAAKFDTILTGCMAMAFGMPLDEGSILIQNFDVTTKVLRLQKLAKHHGRGKTAAMIGKFKKRLESHSQARNTIAHATFIGVHSKDPTYAVFSPPRAFISRRDEMEMLAIPVSVMLKDIAFYHRAAIKTARLYDLFLERNEKRK